jgi:hypothetical protein
LRGSEVWNTVSLRTDIVIALFTCDKKIPQDGRALTDCSIPSATKRTFHNNTTRHLSYLSALLGILPAFDID